MRAHWTSTARYGMMARMDSPTFGLQAAGASGDLLDEWHTLVRQQAYTLAALLSRMQTAVATLRQRQAPAARWQALAAEAERVLTAQTQKQVSLERELVQLGLAAATVPKPTVRIARSGEEQLSRKDPLSGKMKKPPVRKVYKVSVIAP